MIPCDRSQMTVGLSLLLLGLSLIARPTAAADPPTAPILRLETGQHTAVIRCIGVDAANRYLVTGSDDKTVRVWELASGRLLRILRPPLGAAQEGRVYAVALSPDGSTVAAGGWAKPDGKTHAIYLFDRGSGQIRQRLSGLPNAVDHLTYSSDGQFLAAMVKGKGNGLRVYRSSDGQEVARDTAYDADSYGAAFDASGRLVTTSYDGFVRLYDRTFRLLHKRPAQGGKRPHRVAFAPDGTRVAVGYDDTMRVDVLDGQDLTPRFAPDTTGVDNGNLVAVAWSADGQTLYAGGKYWVQGGYPIRRWAAGGRGPAADVQGGAQSTILALLPLAAGGVVFGASDPAWGVLDAAGQRPQVHGPAIADFRDNQAGFLLAPDGAIVQWSYVPFGTAPARFALPARTLTLAPAPDPTLTARAPVPPG